MVYPWRRRYQYAYVSPRIPVRRACCFRVIFWELPSLDSLSPLRAAKFTIANIRRAIIATSSNLAGSFRFADAGIERVDCELGLLLVNDQRRSESHGILARPKDQQTLFERRLNHAVSQLGRSLLGFLVAHELDSDHESLAANVADAFVPLGPIGDLPKNEFAHSHGVGFAFPFQHSDGG